LLLLFYTIALLAFYQGLEKDRAGLFIVSLVFLALATRERLLALFFLPVAFLYVILLVVLPVKKPPGLRWRNLAIFFGPVMLGAAIFVWPFVSHFNQWMLNFGPPNNQPIWILAGVVYYTGAPLICLATFGGIHLLSKQQRSGLYFLLGAFIPLLAMMAISLVHYSANRYVFISLTSWVILGGMAASLLFEAIKKPDRFLAFGVLAVLVVSSLTDLGMYFLYQNGNRENWKGALNYIQQNNRPGEQVIMDEPQVGQIYLGVEPLDFQDFSYPQLDQPQQSLWFIEDADAQSQFAPQLEWVHENARLERIFDVTIQGRLYPMRVYHYIPEP
jgi:hypothetical protein